jgi:hypothetical protein
LRRKASSFFFVESEVVVEDDEESVDLVLLFVEVVDAVADSEASSSSPSSPFPATDLRFLLFFSASFASPGGRPKRVV